MKLKTYLEKTNQTANSFAGKHKLPSVTVWRAARGKVVRPSMALRISDATGKKVKTQDLLYPSA
jgi:hypothetical protein